MPSYGGLVNLAIAAGVAGLPSHCGWSEFEELSWSRGPLMHGCGGYLSLA